MPDNDTLLIWFWLRLRRTREVMPDNHDTSDIRL